MQQPCEAHTHPMGTASPPPPRASTLPVASALACCAPSCAPSWEGCAWARSGREHLLPQGCCVVAWRLLPPPLWRSSCLLHALLCSCCCGFPWTGCALGRLDSASVSAALRRRTRNSPAGHLLGQALGAGGITTFLCAFYSIFLLNFCFDFYLVFLFFISSIIFHQQCFYYYVY